MDEAGKATVSRLIEFLAGRAPISQAPEIMAQDVVSHMDGHTFRGINTWANWLCYVRTRSRVGSPDLETDRLVTNADGTVTAHGRWKGRKDGEPVLSPEVWARYRVVDGKAALTKVAIGNRAPGSVEILKGLAANDIVITDGQMKLKDGAPVSVIPLPPSLPPAAPGAAPAAPGAPAAKS